MSRTCLLVLLLAGCAPERETTVTGYSAEECPYCTEWNAPHDPFQIFGNTYYVGTEGLGAVLITSPDGHVLIDAGLPESAPLILEHIDRLGFEAADIDLILNSHAHFDHAGGIAAIQQASGARVAASAGSAPVLQQGRSGPDDPQYGVLLDFPPVPVVERFNYGDTLRAGSIAMVAHQTAGHTPGGTSWSWRACEGDRCLDLVYADSQTPVSADDFRYTDSATYPTALADFERGFRVLEGLSCDILLTPHPGASALWERMEAGALVDPDACRARRPRQVDRRSSGTTRPANGWPLASRRSGRHGSWRILEPQKG